jgi:SAM-dependent methyltransferase
MDVDDPKRAGAKQPFLFRPEHADRLDDRSRFEYLPPLALIGMLDPPPHGLVVDFGAGTGTYAIEIARGRPDLTVIAVDEQQVMLDKLLAKPQASQLPNLRTMLSEQVGQLRGCADRVLALNVLHELGDDALAGLADLLVADGFVLFVDWNAEVDRPAGPARHHTYTPQEAIERLGRFGYRVEPLGPLPYHFALRARPKNPSR